MNIAILETIASLRTRIERLEALEIPAQESGASVYVAYVAVGAPDYGILRIDDNGNEMLLNSGLPNGCSVVNIAVSPTDTGRIAVLVNFPGNPYPVFAVQGGIVIRGDPLGGYPTNGGTCLYVATDGETFAPVELPTANGDSDGRVCMGINNVEWDDTTLVIIGAVDYLWSGVVTKNNALWRWSSGSAATAQFETTGTMSIPFLTIVGQDEDVVSLELMDPFTTASARIAYATNAATNWTIQDTGVATALYSGADLLPNSRDLVAGKNNASEIVLLSDYRIAVVPSVIGTVHIRTVDSYPRS